MISPLPGAIPTKPGSATLPCAGTTPAIVDADGRVLEGPGEGNLVENLFFDINYISRLLGLENFLVLLVIRA